jgi:DNA-binding PadR family transcriptional regulator
MAAAGRSNPLALAVLSCLAERPMHPYEIASTLKERGKHESIKLNYGSLYTVVESLVRRGLIAEQETVREGRRPERTIYAITEAGQREHDDWLSDMVSEPAKEFVQFEAALSLAGGLPPADFVPLLRKRRDRLHYEIRQLESIGEAMAERGIPEVFYVEGEYRIALKKAELAFAEELIHRITDRKLGGLELWEQFHEGRAAADDVT